MNIFKQSRRSFLKTTTLSTIVLTIILLLTGSIAFTVNAQQRFIDPRNNETKIADLVMLLPAKDAEMLHQIMQELIQLDNVIPNLASKLLPSGQGDDSQVRSAIRELALYASKGNNANEKKKTADELCKAIQQVESDEFKEFLLNQLQYVAGNESVDTAVQYLENESLADAAALVLTRVGNNTAGKALLDAGIKIKTSDVSGKNKLEQSIIKALGDLQYEPALEFITQQLFETINKSGMKYVINTVPSEELKKTALHSLAQIASPKSEKLLAQMAAQSKYRDEQTGATEAYLLFLRNSLIHGRKTMAIDASKKLLKQTSRPEQFTAYKEALNLYASATGEKAIPEIVSALGNKDENFRETALSIAATIQSPQMTDALLKKAKKANGRPKAEIITFFSDNDYVTALPFILGTLKDKNPEVVEASIGAAGKLGREQAVIPIIETMKKGTKPSVIEAGKNALLTINSANLLNTIAKSIPQATPLAKVAFMEILASHPSSSQSSQSEFLFSQTASADANVRLAAYKALASVVTERDIPRINQLLNTATNKDEITALQQTFFAAISKQSQDKQADLVMMQAKRSNNPGLYGNILAMIGGKKALDIMMDESFNSGNDNLKETAFEALANWSDDLAMPQLYKIAADDPSGPYFDKALAAYISKTESSNSTPEQKLILLRDALEIANTPAQKEEIIKQIANTGTFLGIIASGKYLDDPNENVQQAAIQTILSIALNHPEYYGKAVTDLLNKAILLNKNPEASNQQQAVLKHLAASPQDEGFVSMFNGKDLTGWKGLVENPIARAQIKPDEMARKQAKADEIMRQDWKVENGLLVYTGKGFENLCSAKTYGDFEFYADWRIDPDADSGIYLRGSPQVQIWDSGSQNAGAEVGSGGLFNNLRYPSKPLVVADNPAREWNSFYIRMVGDKVTVYLNGQLVTDHTILENYWNRTLAIFPEEAIELQAHNSRVEFRDIYVREITAPQTYEVSDAEKKEGFIPLYNGINMTGWVGNLNDYYAKDGMIICDPERGGHGNLYTEKEYSDFIVRFEFLLTPAANNGLGIRAPLEGDAAYVGMELQILDDNAEIYKDLHDYQYHGSVYGVIPAKRGYLKPVGEWNYEEVIAKGNRITITLNGTVIVDGDIAEASKNFTSTIDGNEHPGLSNKQGHIGFLGHGSWVAFKNLRIKEIEN